jgi:5,10-methenyltetrahydrofolate synthetase
VNVAPEPPNASTEAERSARRSLRARLLAEREAFVASAGLDAASALLSDHLRAALVPLEPACLGLYWPLRSEFNAASELAADAAFDKVMRALPYARRSPRSMEFRRWDGAVPTVADECGIASSDGAAVVPDVVVVPCVGFTAAGHRLGYGGGYYDRWLAAHPHAVAIGLAWSFAEIDLATFAARPHDVPLALIVTERGVR